MMNPDEQQPTPAPVASDNVTAATPLAAPVAADTVATKEPLNAGLIILQWLTYAFWGWTVLALSILTVTVINSFVNASDDGGFTPYGIAAVLVLLPISYICDSFYSKKEPAKKTGPEMWVMIVHAVIFALFGIGALIAAVISLVMFMTDSSGSKGTLVSLYSALIITVFYALTFARTLNPTRLHSLQRNYKMIMIVTVGIIALLGVVGPLAKERTTRDDKLVVAEISNLSSAINNYATTNNRLPDNLAVLDLKDDTKKMVDKKLVEYKPEGEAPASATSIYDTSTISRSSLQPVKKTFHYQLCATFTKETNDYSAYSSDNTANADGYSADLYVYEHPAGVKCYKVSTGYED